MPELPEVETLCRMMRRLLTGKTLTWVKASKDDLVFKGVAPEVLEHSLREQVVAGIGRRGKYFWLSFESEKALIGHLGMSGWVEATDCGQAPKFTKLIIGPSEKDCVAFTDGRRLGRIWMTDDPRKDPTIQALGFDALDELPAKAAFHDLFKPRKAPIKAVLLDQGLLTGIGNYLADEILYNARISPLRGANTLTKAETSKLRASIVKIVGAAVDAEADENRFPEDWLFHHRWGGKRGAEKIGNHDIVRETVGGRTTAWVPKLQK